MNVLDQMLTVARVEVSGLCEETIIESDTTRLAEPKYSPEDDIRPRHERDDIDCMKVGADRTGTHRILGRAETISWGRCP